MAAHKTTFRVTGYALHNGRNAKGYTLTIDDEQGKADPEYITKSDAARLVRIGRGEYIETADTEPTGKGKTETTVTTPKGGKGKGDADTELTGKGHEEPA